MKVLFVYEKIKAPYRLKLFIKGKIMFDLIRIARKRVKNESGNKKKVILQKKLLKSLPGKEESLYLCFSYKGHEPKTA
ncbi:MAG: hypothetical protein WCR53_05695 [Bacteroidaceae bacterium]